MKKQLLTLFTGLALCYCASAQSSFPIFGVSNTTGIQATPQPFGGATYTIGTFPTIDATREYLQVSGSVSDQTGGGVIIRNNNSTSLGYTGNVQTTTLNFDLFRNDAATELIILLRSRSNQQFGFAWNLKDSANYTVRRTPHRVSVPVSQFTLIQGDTLGGTYLADSILQTAIPEIIISLPQNSAEVYISNIRFESSITLGLEEESLAESGLNFYPNPCNEMLYLSTSNVSYTLTNSLGVIVLNGKGSSINLSSLEKGIYHILLENGVREKIIKN